MYIIQNAFRNVLRNRSRNILIGTIIFIIIITTVIALMINNTTQSIITDYKGRFGAEVKISPNMERVRERAMANSSNGMVMITRPVIPTDQYMAFGESEYLQGSLFTATAAINCDSITSVAAELGPGSGKTVMTQGGPANGGNSAAAPSQELFYFKLLGNLFAEFDDGTRELSEGRLPENTNECIISTDLAEHNGLAVGDKLQAASVLNSEDAETYDISYDLEIVGTYFDITDEYPEGATQNSYTNRRNEILTTYETVIAPLQEGMRGIQVQAVYYLKSPDMLDAFAEEVYSKGLDDVFDVTTDEASYNKIVGPVEGLKGISITFMVIVLIFGGFIIALLSSIAIRERKYEIGVLRAMGMKKHKVAFGLWTEMLMITGFCLVIGLAAGAIIAQPVTNALLANQIEAAKAAEDTANAMTGGMKMMLPGSTGAISATPLSEINILLTFGTVAQIIGISLLLASFAAFMSIVRITKYEPIKILMERN